MTAETWLGVVDVEAVPGSDDRSYQLLPAAGRSKEREAEGVGIPAGYLLLADFVLTAAESELGFSAAGSAVWAKESVSERSRFATEVSAQDSERILAAA